VLQVDDVMENMHDVLRRNKISRTEQTIDFLFV